MESAIQRLQPAPAPLEGAYLPHAEALERGDRAVVAEPDLLGPVGIGGERKDSPGLDAHLREGARRVELADGLAEARRRDLNRDPAVGDRCDGRLVEMTGIALGQRVRAAPHLDQVGVRQDVEEPRPGALGKCLEVAPPNLVGVARPLPDVPARMVDGVIADEVNGADHVVEVASRQQLGGASLGAGDEVALDPQLQLGASDELAVGIQVVAGLFLPEGVAPERERLGEAVDVLGDPQLRDPGLGRSRQVAIDVLGGEEALGRRAVLVGTEMHVVVGQHGPHVTGLECGIAAPRPGTLARMVHLRIVVPNSRSKRVVDLLEATPSVSSLVYLEGAGRKPAGDVILCDVAREDASVVIDDLKELGVPRDGSIALEQIDSLLSEAADRAERAAPGSPGDAVVWEEVESRTSESIELNANFLAFIALACLIASVGVLLGQPILIVGAMVVGPEFGPLAGLCVAAVERRRDVALRSLSALAVGFPLGITAAFLFALIAKSTGLIEAGFKLDEHPLTEFISEPNTFSFIVAFFAGIAGVLSLTSAKSGALVGVLISVTTIPAAAAIGIAAAYGDWPAWRGSMAQLAINLSAIVIAGVTTLLVQHTAYRRRRRQHRGDNSRAAGGLPIERAEHGRASSGEP